MGPTPLQIMIVVGIALLLFAAGRIADLGRGPREGGRAAKGTGAPPGPAPQADPEPEPDEPSEASEPEAGAGAETDGPDRADGDEERAR
ncbi:MAG: hypothetical protein HY908_00650 [Myxococcales bacterium]|nr:hypothetical protein [Myxococcales bacterium]